MKKRLGPDTCRRRRPRPWGIAALALISCAGQGTDTAVSAAGSGGGGTAFAPESGVVATQPVGAVAGGYDTSSDGAASYSIPIVVPQGRAGIEPRLAAVYSSRQGHGMLGVGWTLGGLSEITRCSKRLATHGTVAGVTFTNDDAFCLDGQHLVLVSSAEGEREYRTEQDSGSRIFARDISAAGPARWEVRNANGTWLEFGNVPTATADRARVSANVARRSVTIGTTVHDPENGDSIEVVDSTAAAATVHISWHLRRLRDRIGNFLEVDYDYSGDGVSSAIESTPTSIRYAGFEPQGIEDTGDVALAPRRRVELVWETRTDPRYGYMNGVLFGATKRLSQIRTYVRPSEAGAEVLAGSYSFSYTTSSSSLQSLLASVTRCDGSGLPGTSPGPVCLPATTFSYSTAPLAFDDTNTGIGTGLGFHAFTDVNEDGRDDIVVNPQGGVVGRPINGELRNPFLHLSEGATFRPGVEIPGVADTRSLIRAVDPVTGRNGLFWYTANNDTDPLYRPRMQLSTALLPDVPVLSPAPAPLPLWSRHTTLGGGEYFSPPTILADMNGNGASDAAIITPTSRTSMEGEELSGCSASDVMCDPSNLCDANAPQSPGLCPTRHSRHSGWISFSADRFSPRPVQAQRFPVRERLEPNLVTVFDYDSDGRQDVLFRGAYVEGGPEQTLPTGQSVRYRRYSRAFIDDTGSVQVLPTNLRAGSLSITPAPTAESFRQCQQFADINGDGLRDVVTVSGMATPSENNNGTLWLWTPGSYQYSARFNTGNGFRDPSTDPLLTSTMPPAVFCATSGPGVHVLDLNRDGRDDFVVFDHPAEPIVERQGHPGSPRPDDTFGAHLLVWLSVGGGYRYPMQVDISGAPALAAGHRYRDARVADVNGDGMADFVAFVDKTPSGSDSAVDTLHVLKRRGDVPDLLTGVRTGLGHETAIEYAPVNRRDVHQPTTCEYPQRCVSADATPVVVRVGESNGSNASLYQRSFRYVGGRIDLRGRGSLGFEKFSRIDDTTGARDTEERDLSTVFRFSPRVTASLGVLRADLSLASPGESARYTYPFVGRVRRRVSVVNTGSNIVASVGETELSVAQGYPLARTQTYTVRTGRTTDLTFEEPTWDDDSTPSSATPVSEHMTDVRLFDDNGYVRSYDDAWWQDGQLLEWNSIDRNYTHNESAWIFGMMDRESVVSYPKSGAPRRRTVAWEYTTTDRQVGSPSVVVVEPDNARRLRRSQTSYAKPFRLPREIHTSAWRGQGEPSDSAMQQTRSSAMEYDDEGVHLTQQRAAHSGDASFLTVRFDFYRPLGIPVRHIDERGAATLFRYDGFGRMREVIGPDGGVAGRDYTFDSTLNRLSVERHANDGSASTTTFDMLGRVVRAERLGFDGRRMATVLEYDPSGDLHRVSRPFPASDAPFYWTTYTRDGMGRPREVSTPSGTTRIEYGRRETHVTDPDSRVTTTEVDAMGRMVRRIQGAATSGAAGLAPTETVEDFVYGAFSQLTLIRRRRDRGHPHDTATTPVDLSFEYDDSGVQVRRTDPDLGVFEFDQNGFGEPVRSVRRREVGAPILRDNRIEYDDLGRELRSYNALDSASETTLVWDTAPNGVGMLATIAGPAQSVLAHGDLAVGRVVETFEYDHLGRGVEHSYQVRGETFSLRTDYDGIGRVSRVYYPLIGGADRFSVRMDYNANGALEELSGRPAPLESGPESMSYWRGRSVNEYGQFTGESFGNETTTRRTFDPGSGRLQSIQTFRHKPGVWSVPLAGGAVPNPAQYIQWLDYSWSPAGDLTARRNLQQNATEAFEYDSLHRVRSSTTYKGVLASPGDDGYLLRSQYEYDSLGNRVQFDGRTACFGATCRSGETIGPQQLAWVDGPTGREDLHYDALGRMRSRTRGGIETRSVEFGDFDLPTRVNDSVAAELTYGFSGSGERVLEVDKNATTLSIGEMYERKLEPQSDGSVRTTHLFRIAAAGAVVAEVSVVQVPGESDQTAARWVHQDHLGSVDSVTDATGALLSRVRYSAFGRELSSDWLSAAAATDDPGTRTGYTGHRADRSLGVIHARGRSYDPELGVFLSADPLLNRGSQGLNRYSYVSNNPLAYTDPSGFQQRARCEGYPDCALVVGARRPTRPGQRSELAPSPSSESPRPGPDAHRDRTTSLPNGQAADPFTNLRDGVRTHSIGAFLQTTLGRGSEAIPKAAEWAMSRVVRRVGGQDAESVFRTILTPWRIMAEGVAGLPGHYLRFTFEVNTDGSQASQLQVVGSGAMMAFIAATAGLGSAAGGAAARSGAGEVAASATGVFGRMGAALGRLFGRGGGQAAAEGAGEAAVGETATSAASAAGGEAGTAMAPTLDANFVDGAIEGMRQIPTFDAEGVLNVGFHSDAQFAWVVRAAQNGRNVWTRINKQQVAEWIQRLPYSSQTIRLIACNAGAEANGLAQYLANYLGKTVIAATSVVRIAADGAYALDRGGRWVAFTPQ